jgi:hypothetical protein
MCTVCGEVVRGGVSRVEHERGTIHRFNLFAEQPHADRDTQVQRGRRVAATGCLLLLLLLLLLAHSQTPLSDCRTVRAYTQALLAAEGTQRLQRLRAAEDEATEKLAAVRHEAQQRSTVGYRLLRKAGWKEGDSIGLRGGACATGRPDGRASLSRKAVHIMCLGISRCCAGGQGRRRSRSGRD